MNSEWKVKALAVLIAVLGGIYVLLPTALQLDTQRAAFEKTETALPWYFHLLPKHGLTLGLDLQGGIYVELEVELEEAIRRKTDILGNEIKRILTEKNATPTAITQSTIGELEFTFGKAADYDVFESEYRRYYRPILAMGPVNNAESAPKVRLSLTDVYRDELETDVIAQATESVRNRINRYGVGEPDIRRQGTDRIAIELPGIADPERALELIKRTGQLELRLVHEVSDAGALQAQQNDIALKIAETRAANNIAEDDYTLDTTTRLSALLKDKIPADTEIAFELIRDPDTQNIIRGTPYLIGNAAQVTGDMLEDARVDQSQTEPVVSFTLNSSGTKLFANLTKENVGKYLAILLDGTVMSAPTIREPILQGRGQIELGSGDYATMNREAHDLALILQEGALPASLHEAMKSIVGPTLGAELIRLGFRATWIAALCVLLFMLLYYRVAGLVADVAVICNITMILGILTLFDATLTLPGIAGIVLTIGMAVDANVIINERIREELRGGKAPKAAVAAGYSNATRTILDANITTLIAGIVLYQYGTGAIKGFAVTLCIGIITTLFTAVVATRVWYDYWLNSRKVERLSI